MKIEAVMFVSNDYIWIVDSYMSVISFTQGRKPNKLTHPVIVVHEEFGMFVFGVSLKVNNSWHH